MKQMGWGQLINLSILVRIYLYSLLLGHLRDLRLLNHRWSLWILFFEFTYKYLPFNNPIQSPKWRENCNPKYTVNGSCAPN